MAGFTPQEGTTAETLDPELPPSGARARRRHPCAVVRKNSPRRAEAGSRPRMRSKFWNRSEAESLDPAEHGATLSQRPPTSLTPSRPSIVAPARRSETLHETARPLAGSISITYGRIDRSLRCSTRWFWLDDSPAEVRESKLYLRCQSGSVAKKEPLEAPIRAKPHLSPPAEPSPIFIGIVGYPLTRPASVGFAENFLSTSTKWRPWV